MTSHLVILSLTYHPRSFHMLNLECMPKVAKFGTFLHCLLKKVGTKVMGVTERAPCKSVCDLSPKTTMANGMYFPSVPQNLLRAGIQASPV